jgi:prevent-host-death family protein
MSIPAAVFKAECLKLMDEVARTGQPVVITKHGKPVAQLVPVPAAARSMFGYMKNTVTIKGDVVAPTGESWGGDSGEQDFLFTTAGMKPRRRHVGSKKK